MSEKWKKLLSATWNGKLLMVLGFDRYLGQIVYFFACALIFIGINLHTDKTLHELKENRRTIENLQSIHTDITCRLTELDSVCEVEGMLQNIDSKVQIPIKRAKILK